MSSTLVVPMTCSAPKIRSTRARTVARWFGVEQQLDRHDPRDSSGTAELQRTLETLIPQPGRLVLITGASGSGKSSLLRVLRRKQRDSWIDLAGIRLAPRRAVVDCFGDTPLDRVLCLLARVGLAEAWTYLKRVCDLSDGQRWRLRLAIAIVLHDNRIIASDEFCAPLDRITARVVAACLRRTVTAAGLRAVVATSHDDLADALQPDVLVRCDFARIEITTPGTPCG